MMSAQVAMEEAQHDAAHSPHGGDSEIMELKIMKPYVESKVRCCAIACGVHCCCLLIFVACFGAFGSTFMFNSTGVALHLWNEKYNLRNDAMSEATKICTFDPLAGDNQRQQEHDKIGSTTYEITIVYKATSGNMLTVDRLNKVKQLENRIVEHTAYRQHCLRVSGSEECQPGISVVNACDPRGALPCSDSLSTPPGVYECSSSIGPCPRNDYSHTTASLESKLTAYSTAPFGPPGPETTFLYSVDVNFGPGTLSARALQSRFTFGFPLAGYNSTSERADDQKADMEQHFSDAYFEVLNEFNQGDDADEFQIGFAGGNLAGLAINGQLMQDFALVGLAFLVVWLYVVFMSRSIFLSTMAMVQIFSCFIIGFILYRLFFFNPFFGTFHIIAIFLLCGVGVDDMFVFQDHFEAALHVNPAHADNLWARLSWTWKLSCTAMGVTSLTTATSFFLNATSSFPGIASFGVFAGCLVVAMYTSMCFFWPALVCFNDRFFKSTPFCFGIADRQCCANSSEEMKEPLQHPGEIPKPALVRFFEDHFSWFILSHRVKILIVFLGVSVYMFYNIALLAPEKEAAPFLPDSHPIQMYMDVSREHFVRGGGDFNTKVGFAFGFDPDDPINREGADPLGEAFGEGASSEGAFGQVNWNPSFDAVNGILQGSECIIQLCNAAEIQNSERNTGGQGFDMRGCWLRDLKEFTNDTEWNKVVSGDVSAFYTAFNAKETDPSATQPWAQNYVYPYVYAQQGADGTPEWKWIKTELTLTSSTDIGYVDGIELANAWENFLTDEMTRGNCSSQAVRDSLKPFIYSNDFEQFYVSETLISEMSTGVIISISVALVVLVLVTGNFVTGFLAALNIAMIVCWVMAMIPVFGWELGMVENIVLVMVPGLSVDFTAHLAEAYNGAKYDDREHRVIHALEHSGVSIISGAISTMLAALCLLLCGIQFFYKFGILILFTVGYAVLFSLFFFPSVMALVGPTGVTGDWHHLISPTLDREMPGDKPLRVSARTSVKARSSQRKSQSVMPKQVMVGEAVGSQGY